MQRCLVLTGKDLGVVWPLAREFSRQSGCPVSEVAWGDLRAQVEAGGIGPLVDSQRLFVLGGPPPSREERLWLTERAIVVVVDSVLKAGDGPPGNGWSEFGRECHARVKGNEGGEGSVASSLMALVRRDPILVAVGERSYLVEVGCEILGEQLGRLGGFGPRLLLVTDRNVKHYQGRRIEAALARTGAEILEVVLTPGEENKHWVALGEIYDRALAGGLDRGCSLVAVGGGVVTDMGGFAASCWMRGIRWVGAPTTLLAMVDASVGGKTGVDHGTAKNALGAFWQPACVICDVKLLETEAERNFRSALAEVVKTAMVGDGGMFTLLETRGAPEVARDPQYVEELVRRSIRVKASVVSRDERESGLRAVLNLGHTVGHALESSGGYCRWTHGEAVSLGLVYALKLGVRLGKTPRQILQRTEALLERLGLPVSTDRSELREASQVIQHDKKRRGDQVSFVFARDLGQVERVGLPLKDLVGELACLE